MGSASHHGHNGSQRNLLNPTQGGGKLSSEVRCVLRGLGAKSFAIAALSILIILAVRAGDKKVDVSKVHGRIQYVKSFPDYKVQAVTSFPDLRVQVVESF